MFASSGANEEVLVYPGNWPGEVMNRDYSDSPNLTVRAVDANPANTVVNGITLTGASFDGLTFQGLTFTGDAPTPSGFDPGYAVEIVNNGNYANLAFVNNVFDGQNVENAAAIFSNRGFDGFLLDNNTFVNYNEPMGNPEYFSNFSLVFMEAQVYTPAGRGNNYVATNNNFVDIRHLNSLEAFRWQNVTMSGNTVTGTFGRLLIWSYDTDPLLNVNITDNNIDIGPGNSSANSTGIGVFYVEGDVNITGNTVNGANTCLNTTGVTDLEVFNNDLENCATTGLLFDDSDFDDAGPDPPYVAPVSASIIGNTFTNMPTGVENSAQTFELDVCNNTFINVAQNEFSNPGPFAPCGSITIVKETNPAAPWLDWVFEGTPTIGAFTLDVDDGDMTHPGQQTFDLAFGDYTITETGVPGNWDVTGISCDVGNVSIDLANASVTITLDQQEQDATCTFTNERRPQIQITKYNDLNANGQRDNGEPGVENWQMFIYEPDGNGGWTQIMPREVRTNANGIANYTNLEPNGTYLVCEERRAGWGNTDPNDGFDIINGQICQEVPNLQYGENRPVVFGNVECNLTVEAGEDKRACRTKTIQLGGASFSGFATQATWSVMEQPEGGNAEFIGANPSATPSDVVFKATVPGTYVLQLTTDAQFGCDPVSDTVTIEVLNVACGEFPWRGNE